MTFGNDDVYEGYWENDVPHGEGIMTWRYSGFYIGGFEHGKP
jgi:hypothetical protein